MPEDTPFFLSFGEVLKDARKRRKLTQKQLAHLMGVHYNTISAWELGAYLPETRGLVLELARHLALDGHETRQLLEASLTTLAPLWSVPWLRNPFFTGRQNLLHTLDEALGGTGSHDRPRIAALQGLGGVGKTQVALEYTYRHALEYSALFWVNAEGEEQLTASVLRIAEVLQLPERGEAEQPRIVAAVQRWLGNHDSWLLIWDNLDNPELLVHWLPATRRGTLLLTTRAQALGLLAQGIEVTPMDQEEGIELLIRRAKVLERQATSAPIHQVIAQQPEEYASAVALTRALGGLPLALDQAGAYVEETGCQLSDYLERYRQQGMRLLGRRGATALEGEHPHSVTATVLLAYERARRQLPGAGDLLLVCAFLAAEAIPEEFFRLGAAHLGKDIQTLMEDGGHFDEAIGVLRSFSLVQRQTQARTISLHRLVQEILRAGIAEPERIAWQQQIARALNAAFPEVSHVVISHVEVWERCERLLPHALACLSTLPENAVGQETVELAQRIADYMRERGQYEQAEIWYRRALERGERLLGSEHPLLLPLLSGLGRLFALRGRYEEAEALHQQALRIGEQTPGLEQEAIALPLSGLASIYIAQGKSEQAIILYQRALPLLENKLGSEHPEIATLLSNMSFALLDRGKDGEAEALLLRALHMLEKSLGADHPEVAFPLANLSSLYARAGKYAQAARLLERALDVRTQALGSQHLFVAATKNDLAEIYKLQGEYQQAEVLLKEAMLIMRQEIGEEHPEVAQTMFRLGDLYAKQGQYAQAEPLLKQAAHSLQQALGTEHTMVASSFNTLATLYREQEKYVEAEQFYKQALSIREKCLGQQHPETASTLYDLALLKQKQGEVTQAHELAGRVLAMRVQALGEESPLTSEARVLYEQLAPGVFSPGDEVS